jgi:hypothetical protein
VVLVESIEIGIIARYNWASVTASRPPFHSAAAAIPSLILAHFSSLILTRRLEARPKNTACMYVCMYIYIYISLRERERERDYMRGSGQVAFDLFMEKT